MNSTLVTAEANAAYATSQLTELYAGMIGLTLHEADSIDRRLDEAAVLWNGINRAHFRDGSVEGVIDKHSLSIAWGSLPGLSLAVEVQTQSGPESRLVSHRPINSLFEISPPKEVLPIREDYATRYIEEGFAWKDIVSYYGGERAANPETPLYLVVFRSQRRPEADEELLAEYDRRAHEAAKQSESLLYYFGGEADEQGNCLSFCLWADREEAGAIAQDPTHKAAARLTGQMYSSFSLELFDIHKDQDKPVFVQYV